MDIDLWKLRQQAEQAHHDVSIELARIEGRIMVLDELISAIRNTQQQPGVDPQPPSA